MEMTKVNRELRPTVANFAQEMERQLQAHAIHNVMHAEETDNEGWSNISLDDLCKLMEDQVAKVRGAVDNFVATWNYTTGGAADNRRRHLCPYIVKHATHVANFAMMVADVAQARTNAQVEFESKCGAAICVHRNSANLWLEFKMPSGKSYAVTLDPARIPIGKNVLDELANLMCKGDNS